MFTHFQIDLVSINKFILAIRVLIAFDISNDDIFLNMLDTSRGTFPGKAEVFNQISKVGFVTTSNVNKNKNISTIQSDKESSCGYFKRFKGDAIRLAVVIVRPKISDEPADRGSAIGSSFTEARK